MHVCRHGHCIPTQTHCGWKHLLSNCWVGLDWYCVVYLPTCESFFQYLWWYSSMMEHVGLSIETPMFCWLRYNIPIGPTKILSMGYPTVHPHDGPKWPNWSVKCGFQLVICPVLMFSIQLGQDCRGLICSFLSKILGVPYCCYYYYYYPWTGNPVPKQPVVE